MKTFRCLILFGALLAGLPVARAQDDAGAAAPVAPTSPLIKEFLGLMGRMQPKLQVESPTPEMVAPELKELDALIARYAPEKSDEIAYVAGMRGRIYLDVFKDTTKGIALLKQIVTDFPGTKNAEALKVYLPELEARLAREAASAPGQPFPDFAAKDLNGQPLSISRFKGKIVLVDFWATWCGPCVAELPNVLAAYGKYHDRGFEIIGISLDEQKERLTAFLQDRQMDWPQYFDGLGWKNKLVLQYGITGIPATFLLDREGRIIARDLRGDELEAKLAELLQ